MFTPTAHTSRLDAAITINELTARYPQTLAVLQRFGLDSCCGGPLPLSTAAEHHQVALDVLLAELRAVVEPQR